MRLTGAQRLGLRFAFVYVFLYFSPTQLFDVIPGMDALAKGSVAAWNVIVPWVATHVFGIAREVKFVQTGSGDTTADYVQLACNTALAVAVTAVWTFVGRRPPFRDKGVYTVLRTYVRYSLGIVLLGYGFAKVFVTQFSFPRPEHLLTPLGNASPMGLVWRFMGYSAPYTFFTGLAEVTGGVLLFFRRTTTLGALILVGVMINVVMINYCYDVPVKLFSTHLLLMAIFLAGPDLRRLAAVLLQNRPAPAADLRPHDLLVRFRGAHIALKTGFLGLTLGMMVYSSYEGYKTWGPGAPRSPLYGAYEVETFASNGTTIAPLLTETGRWRRVAVNNFMWSVFLMDDTTRRYPMEYDAAAGKVTLKQGEDKEYVLTVTRPDSDHLQVDGAVEANQVSVRLKKIDIGAMPLASRGFRWINEFPFNR